MMKDRNRVLISGLVLSAFLLALPALAQPSPPWCSADPLTSTPFPAPKWSQLAENAKPDYGNVSSIFHVNQSLRLLISGLEKTLQQLKDGKSLAGTPDVDGICLCNCGRDVSSWIDFIGTTVKTETVEALQKTEDRYLADLDAQLGKTLNTIDTTVPAFRMDLEKILRDTCTSNPSLCKPQVPNTDPNTLFQHASGAANDKVEMIFKTELATIRPLVVGPNNLRQRLENLRTEVHSLLTTLPDADSASIAGQEAKIQQILDDAKSILDDVRAGSQALAAAYQAADLASWTSQIGQAVKDRLAQGFQGSTGSNLGEKVLAQIKQAAQNRVQAIKASAQDLYNTALQHRSSIDQFSATFTDGVLHDLQQVAGCYGTTKRKDCTLSGFCQGTSAGQLFGQEDLTLPLWYPTEVFKDGKTALRYALATVDWLAKVREFIEKGPSPKLLAGGQKLIDVLKNGQKLLDELNRYVDTYTEGYNLGAYSDVRRDLHFCVGYGGSGALAELFEFSVGDKHVRGGASYLSTNLSEKHRFQLRSGGFDVNINGRSLPLAPGLSLNSQIDGFRLWDMKRPFGIQGFPTISSQDVGRYDIFNLANEKELENNVCGNGQPCNLLVNALYQPYFPIQYTLPSSGAHEWPRAGVAFDQDARLTSVFGAGLNLDLEMKTQTWNIAPIMVFPGATVTPWLSLDAGVDWHYKANGLRDTLVTSINKNLPAGTKFDLKGFNRDGQALQADDVTEDVEAGAHVNPKLGADLTVGLDLASWLKVGITADLYVGVDVDASGAGGVLDLNRALVETLANSNPPGDDCKPVIEDNVTTVCSNTFFQKPDRCAGKEDCVDRSRPFPGPQLYSTGTYVCKGEGTACGDRGYCATGDGTILAHDVTREECVPVRIGTLAVRLAPTARAFFPYQCVSTSRPQVTGYKGPDCNPIEYGYPSACEADGSSCACEPGPSATCATGRSCVEGACLKTCGKDTECASGQACRANRCVLANGVPFVEQIVWRMKNAGQPRYSIASYALNRLITSAALGVGVKVGMDYRIFSKWRSRNLLDFHKSIPLLTLPFVKHQLGLEARYQDDCDPSLGTVINHQTGLVQRYPGGGTPAQLVAWCKPQAASDAQNPVPPQEVQTVIAQGLDDTYQFAVDLSGDYWQRAQVCIGRLQWDAYLTGLKANPAGLWPLLRCSYLPWGDRAETLDCAGPAALQSSLAAALGCLDTLGPDALPYNRQLRNILAQDKQLSNWLTTYQPRSGGLPVGPPREVLDLSKILRNPDEALFFTSNVQTYFLTLDGRRPDGALPPFSVGLWLAALSACLEDRPTGRFDDTALNMTLQLSADDFKPCGGACCSGGVCTDVASQADCTGGFQAARTCAQVAAGGGCSAKPDGGTGDGGACFAPGGCQNVLSAAQCPGSLFLQGVQCGTPETQGLCAHDEDCVPGNWCRSTQSGSLQCVPRVGEGAGCEGNVVPWARQRCASGLTCIAVEPTFDVPGICERTCAPQPQALAAWWPFDETTGPITADLLARNDGQHGGSPIPTSGKVGGAIQFDGVKDFVTVPEGPDLDFGTGDFSIVTWIRTTQHTGAQSILDKRAGGIGYHLYLFRGRLGLQLADGGYSNYTSNILVADGLWHLVAVTVERGHQDGIRWYLDGQEVGPRADPTGHPGTLDSPAPLVLAARTTLLDGWWKGALDELFLVSRALTPAEIQRLNAAAQIGLCRCAVAPRGLAAWWPIFDFFSFGPVEDTAGVSSGKRIGDPQTVPGKVNVALSFDGVQSYVEVDSTPALRFGTGNFSIEGWLQTSQTTGAQSILDKRGGGVGYHLFLYRGRLGLQLGDANGYDNYVSGALVADGAWHHFAVTVERGRKKGIRWYLDGQEVAPRADPTLHPSSLDSSAPLRFAVRSSSLDGYWKGALDELSLYSRALEPQEVLSIYRAQTFGKCPVTPPLVPFPP